MKDKKLNQNHAPIYEVLGTHFYFGENMPVSAMEAGADMAAVSMHKSGGSLTQSSLLLVGDRLPLLLCGEHLVTLGNFKAVQKKYPDVAIIHFDAHADLRNDYLGEKLSHACVIRRIHDIIGDGKIHQFCIRSGDQSEFEFAKFHTDMHKFDFDGLDEITTELKAQGIPVYFTIDLDCLDPSVFCGTGTPEAGDVTFPELLKAILSVCNTNIVGADINELAPMLDTSGASTAMACKVLRELLLALNKETKGRK